MFADRLKQNPRHGRHAGSTAQSPWAAGRDPADGKLASTTPTPTPRPTGRAPNVAARSSGGAGPGRRSDAGIPAIFPATDHGLATSASSVCSLAGRLDSRGVGFANRLPIRRGLPAGGHQGWRPSRAGWKRGPATNFQRCRQFGFEGIQTFSPAISPTRIFAASRDKQCGAWAFSRGAPPAGQHRKKPGHGSGIRVFAAGDTFDHPRHEAAMPGCLRTSPRDKRRPVIRRYARPSAGFKFCHTICGTSGSFALADNTSRSTEIASTPSICERQWPLAAARPAKRSVASRQDFVSHRRARVMKIPSRSHAPGPKRCIGLCEQLVMKIQSSRSRCQSTPTAHANEPCEKPTHPASTFPTSQTFPDFNFEL